MSIHMKPEIVKAISEDTGLSQVNAALALNAALKAITESLANGHEVKLRGFGRFTAKLVAAHTARNPSANTAVQVPAKRRPRFSPGEGLKDAVQHGSRGAL